MGLLGGAAEVGGGHAETLDKEAVEGLAALEATLAGDSLDGVVGLGLEQEHCVVEAQPIDIVGKSVGILLE